MTIEETRFESGCPEGARLLRAIEADGDDVHASFAEASFARHLDRCVGCAQEVAGVDAEIARERRRRSGVRKMPARRAVAVALAASLVAVFSLVVLRSERTASNNQIQTPASIEITGDSHAVVAKSPGRYVTVLRSAPPSAPVPAASAERQSS